jgi:hypothetical protein
VSAELVGAAKQLIVILQRYFRPSGHPPEMPKWLFVVNTARAVSVDGVGHESSTFASLAEPEPLDPYLREALDKIPPLQETAETLQTVLRIIDEGNTRDSRLAHLIRRPLEMDWMKSRTASILHADSNSDHGAPVEPDYFGYSFCAIDLGFLDQLRESIDEITAPADTAEKSRKKLPDNADVLDLCALLAKRKPHETEIGISRKFARGDERKARSLLRQARRYRHLYER